MPKPKDVKKSLCEDHYFVIKPQNEDCYFQQSIKTMFCKQSPKRPGNQNKKCYEGPIFNKDKSATTPAFIMKSEKEKFKLSVALIKNQNPEKYFNVCEQKSQLLVPKPSSKSFYCNVCKQKYQDYKQHIQTDKHRNKIHNNQFNKHILKLTSKYQKQRPPRQKIKETNQQTVSQFSNVIIIDEDSLINEASKPKKRYKGQYLSHQHKQPFQTLGLGFSGYYQPSTMSSVPFIPFSYMNTYPLAYPFNYFSFINMVQKTNENLDQNAMNWMCNPMMPCGFNPLQQIPQDRFPFVNQQCKNQCIVIEDDNI